MDISAYEIRVFQELVQTKSISRAAQRLGISQPGLSLLLKKVENYLGAKLLVRTSKGVELTKAGERFAAESKTLLRDLEGLRERVRRQETSLEGVYRVGAHPDIAAFTFPRFYSRLLPANPLLTLKPVHDFSKRITEGVLDHRIDFGIVVTPIKHPDLTIVPLYQDPIQFWRLEKPAPSQNHPDEKSVILCDRSMGQMEEMLSAAYRRGLLKGDRIVDSTDLSVIRSLTLQGVGTGVLPRSIAMAAQGNGLVPLADWPKHDDTICLIYRKDAQHTRASRLIKDTIVDALKS